MKNKLLKKGGNENNFTLIKENQTLKNFISKFCKESKELLKQSEVQGFINLEKEKPK